MNVVGGDLGYELKTYTYDLYNRMTDFESAEHTAHYTYNPDGMRRSKAVDGNPVITHIWNGSEIVAEVGGANPTIQNTYVYGLERIMTGEGEYFTYNSHGDTTGFDGDEYDYDAFGNQIDENAEASYNPFRYCGEYFDEETGFVYLRARYYDPSTQRFVTEDTHWNLDNMINGDRTFGKDETPVPDPNAVTQCGNLYAYCMGNPVMYVDESGNSIILTCIIAGAVIGAIVGGGVGAKVSLDKFGEVSWKYVAGGAVLGGVAGGLIGWGAGAVLVKLGVAGTASGIVGGGGAAFESFDKLKGFLGSAGESNQWHHIVEQCQTNSSRAGFSRNWIQNTNNVVSITKEVHRNISAYYSSIKEFTGGLTVRDWLSTKSFEEQYEFGIKILKEFGVNVG